MRVAHSLLERLVKKRDGTHQWWHPIHMNRQASLWQCAFFTDGRKLRHVSKRSYYYVADDVDFHFPWLRYDIAAIKYDHARCDVVIQQQHIDM